MAEITSTTKLFVGGLPWRFRGLQLRELFSQYGEIVFASVKLDRETRKSRGFGFVEFVNAEDAAKAQEGMNEQDIEGRIIRVDFAKEDSERMKEREEARAAAAAEAEETNEPSKAEDNQELNNEKEPIDELDGMEDL